MSPGAGQGDRGHGASWGLGTLELLHVCSDWSHTSAAMGWDSSVPACLYSAMFSFPRVQMWPESISPWAVQSLPKAQPSVREQVDFAPSRTPLSITSPPGGLGPCPTSQFINLSTALIDPGRGCCC